MTTTLELHVIQTLPPSRVNQGEDGNPKTAVMGGVPRNRISSQAMKATQRNAATTSRTKVPHELVTRALGDDTVDTRAIAMDLMSERYGAYDDRGRLKAMVYLAQTEVDTYASRLRPALATLQTLRAAHTAAPKDKPAQAAYRDALTAVLDGYTPGMSTDLALYGRFVAEAADEAIVAATSYAHAISTHRDNTTPDFFSAVDHVTGETAHIGLRGHAAPTFYRHASLSVDQLRRNLGTDDVTGIIRQWVHGFIHAVPRNGGHGAAASTLPEHVLLIRRRGGHAITLANAFADPAYPSDGDTLLTVSIRKLHEHLTFTETAYQNGTTTKAVLSTHAHLTPDLTPSRTLDDAITAVLE